MIKNNSFENGWTDILTNYGNLVNQQPQDWQITWLEPGETSWAVNQKTGVKPTITTVPECLHKLNSQLPPDEQLGGTNALILDGNATYKMFAFNGVWAASLKQTVPVPQNTLLDLTVPLQVHYHGAYGNEDSPDEVEIWLLIDGQIVKKLFALPDLPNRKWVDLQHSFATSNTQITIELRFMTKWANSRDVFIDNLSLEAANDPLPPPPPPTATSQWNKVNGFHVGIPAYTDGIGLWLQKMAGVGIPFLAKAVDNTGSLIDAQALLQNGATGNAIWRHYHIDSSDNDGPHYHNTPEQEAERYWSSVLNNFPPELDKNIVWVELINEADKNQADWLGQVATLLGQKALQDGFKLVCFGWSSGEPEPQDWLTPGMVDYLTLCSQNPTRLGVSVHEYQFDVTKTLMDNYPYQIGRYQNIHSACGQLGLQNPTIFITEFGWSYQNIPPVNDALEQIVAAGSVYAPENVKGTALWALDSSWQWGNVAQQVHRLMWQDNQVGTVSPLLETLKNNPLTPPPAKYKAIVVKAPQEVSTANWSKLVEYSFQYKHTLTASHDDALFILKNGNVESYAKVYQPNQPSQQQFIALLEAQNLKWVELTL